MLLILSPSMLSFPSVLQSGQIGMELASRAEVPPA